MPKGIYERKIKDYQLLKLEDEHGIYYKGKITNRKGEEFIIYVDEKGKELLESNNWSAHKCGNTYYLERADYSTGKKKTVLFHREISNCDPKLDVDHIDRNSLNNRVYNLRCVTRSINLKNKSKQSNNTSGYIGVSFNKKSNKWKAEIQINGKRKRLGLFNCKKEAAIAYNKEAKKYGFLNLNEID